MMGVHKHLWQGGLLKRNDYGSSKKGGAVLDSRSGMPPRYLTGPLKSGAPRIDASHQLLRFSWFPLPRHLLSFPQLLDG